MTTATVTQFPGSRAPRQRRVSTQLGPREARAVVGALRRKGALGWGAQTMLLEHLLRVCKGSRDYTVRLPQRSREGRDVEGLLDQLGIDRRTLQRAIVKLGPVEHGGAGLVVVERGVGHTWSRYTLQVDRIVELLEYTPTPWANTRLALVDDPVNPGESSAGERRQFAASEASDCRLRGGSLPPPNARVRERDRRKTNTPLPQSEPVTASGGDPPPAAGRGPLPEKCRHNRTVAQNGCRDCGTNPRAAQAQDEMAAREAEHRDRLETQEQRRTEDAAERAAAAIPSPELIAGIREQIRNSNPKGDPP